MVFVATAGSRASLCKMGGLRITAAAAAVVAGLALISGPVSAQAQKQPQPQAQGPAPTKTQKAFDGWIVTCIEAKNAKRCAMSQSRIVAKTRRVLFALSIARDGDKNLVSLLTTPTGVSVQDGIRLAMGDGEPLQVPYNVCGPRACQARLQLSNDLIEQLQESPKVAVNFVQANKRLVQTEIDLKGFSAAYSYFNEQMQ
ncbi:invasion associated locus B family protein [Rhodoligotrophos ferricapiens]|uniref:invasion associated locus B family protein n=1 Tax=Rhodoligotrophos ferricapiens TaxID=3069264 RepID=UPI00315D5E8A